MTPAPVLVVLGGLPGSGKTTLARELARRLRAVHVRIDTLEQAIVQSSLAVPDAAEAGYAAGARVALDNLRLGLPVVADCVNPVARARTAGAGWPTRRGCGSSRSSWSAPTPPSTADASRTGWPTSPGTASRPGPTCRRCTSTRGRGDRVDTAGRGTAAAADEVRALLG